jgi:hypothetical protein
MKSRLPVLIAGGTLILIVVIAGLSLLLTPEKLDPAFDVAVRFVNAAGMGDDATAYPLLSDELQAYVDAHCPDGRVSACILSYTLPEWGHLLHKEAAVYRRSIPDGAAWDVQLIASYQEGDGFSGVCIYNRLEEAAPGDWRVTAWAGFISCDEPNSGLSGLRQPDAPNRAP